MPNPLSSILICTCRASGSVHVICIVTWSPEYFKALSMKFWKTANKKWRSPVIIGSSDWKSICMSNSLFALQWSFCCNVSNISWRLISLMFNRNPWASVDWSNIRLIDCNILSNFARPCLRNNVCSSGGKSRSRYSTLITSSMGRFRSCTRLLINNSRYSPLFFSSRIVRQRLMMQIIMQNLYANH